MHDVKWLMAHGLEAEELFARRGVAFSKDSFEEAVEARRTVLREVEASRHRLKLLSAQVAQARGAGAEVEALKAEVRPLKDDLRRQEDDLQAAEARLEEMLLTLPNIPREDALVGATEEENRVVRTWGEAQPFPFEARNHVALGEALGILDFPRAAKLSGARFAVARGVGARLERALTSLFLDLHQEAGYEEFSVPFLVNGATMQGTGQLPKFEEDLFKASGGGKDLYLIPTAEVPLTNLHAGEVLPLESLPLRYTAVTPCFRSEAGSHGRDTQGLIRLHQFSKVELVNVVPLADAPTALEAMVAQAERCLQTLGLSYRVVELCTGDLGFSARKTYDLEVWLPAQGVYREVSSCSDCGTFQARRMKLRGKDAAGAAVEVATLNGSALPIGRVVAALLEQGQQEDGSVVLPPALAARLGTDVIVRQEG